MPEIDRALLMRNAAAMEKAAPLFTQVNLTWGKIEHFLRQQGVLQPVSIRAFSECDDQDVERGAHHLGVQKAGGSWRICTALEIYDFDERLKWEPITEAPSENRIRMLEFVPELFTAVVRGNEAFVASIEDAVNRSERILSELGLISESPAAPEAVRQSKGGEVNLYSSPLLKRNDLAAAKQAAKMKGKGGGMSGRPAK